MKLFFRFVLLGLLSFVLLQPARAQVSTEFQLAERLIRQQRFEQAADILTELVKKNPTEFIYFDRLIESYIQLKKYDDALTMVQQRAARIQNPAQEHILEAKIYHIKGDTANAFNVWDKTLAENRNQFQVYVTIGNALKEARAYNRAVKVYESARTTFSNEQLFINEIADVQMQAGNYEGAIKEWINLLKIRPEQRVALQRLLARYNDPLIYDVTIMEVEDELAKLRITDNLYKEFYYLQSWLLQENKLYRRALNNAIAYEKASPERNYVVFNLGKMLLDAKEYELAAEAYGYYVKNDENEIRWRSTEELAEVYSEWAKYNRDKHLIRSINVDTLFHKASVLFGELEKNAPNYSRLGNVILRQAELALDFTYDIESAMQAKTALARIEKFADSAEYHYLDGRIELYNRNFTQARIAFTKSNKKADIGSLAEKTRYFLALNDFFSGDFEFANIQLKSLGRQNASYYANDALELRLWIQKNKDADSTKTYASDFAAAIFEDLTGNKEKALQLFTDIAETGDSPYVEDALVGMAGNKNVNYARLTELLNITLSKTPYLAQRERLLWERARSADFASSPSPAVTAADGTLTAPTLVADYYEELLTEYPQSFYAPFARERLQELTKPNS